MTLAIVSVPSLITPTVEDYHADQIGFDRPSLSASCAHTLLSKSPLHAYTDHPRLGNRKRQATRAMDLGSAVHAMLLGVGANVVMVDADNYLTKAAKEARNQILADGDIPLLRDEIGEANEMVDAVRRQLDALGLALDGVSEQAMVWEEWVDGIPVLCKGRMDHVKMDRGFVVDLKTISNAHPSKIQKRFIEHDYHVQHAAYMSAIRALNPDIAGREEMLFVFVESAYPYCVTPAFPDGSMRQLGESRWRRAVETWQRCLRDGRWPGYVDGILSVEAPSFALYQEEQTEDEEEENAA